jgi:succinylarginine dihydrolase
MTDSNRFHEVNFECLVGPTYHFGGHSYGNQASTINRFRPSHPKKAALQSLEKIKKLHGLMVKQAILPPHERPHVGLLKKCGFSGTDLDILKRAHQCDQKLFFSCCSSSSMWTANAATISPSLDSADKLTHLTPANLNSMFHRSIEADFTYNIFQKIFKDKNIFKVHKPLINHDYFADEGAANHCRICPSHQESGIQIFVYGRTGGRETELTKKFPARQSLAACKSLSRFHQLDEEKTFFVMQNQDSIDAGGFHNDIVCVANENFIFLHERAFVDQETILAADHVIDMGPFAGHRGGEIIAEGSPKQVLKNPKSLTGKYINRTIEIKIPQKRRDGNGKSIEIKKAAGNNLKNVDVEIKLNTFTCVTGVSGSGKSSLFIDTLYRALAKIYWEQMRTH